jgi:hypothetical protein
MEFEAPSVLAYRVEASLCTIWRRSALERLSAILVDLAEVDVGSGNGCDGKSAATAALTPRF